MSKTLDAVAKLPHVQFVDDERSEGNSIIVTLHEPWCFRADPTCGVRGFDTVAEAREGCRLREVYEDESRVDMLKQVAGLPHVQAVRNEREAGGDIVVVLKPQYRFISDLTKSEKSFVKLWDVRKETLPSAVTEVRGN